MTAIQVITRDGQPEYAVIPWAEYQALCTQAGRSVPTEIRHQPTLQTASVASVSNSSEAAALTLEQLRHKTGLTPELLAQELGISPSYWLMIESGEREASEVVLRSLRRLANVTV